jgi:hypothetical protein
MNDPINNGTISSMGNHSMTMGNNSNMSMTMNPGMANSMSSQMSSMNGPISGMNGKSMSQEIMGHPQGPMSNYPINNMSSPGPRGRPSPYPNPQSYINQKRVYNTFNTGPGPGNMQGYGPGGHQPQQQSQQFNPNNQVSLKR